MADIDEFDKYGIINSIDDVTPAVIRAMSRAENPRLREVMVETRDYGFEKVRQEQIALGSQVRALFERRGIHSVAADGFKAPGVVVSYTTDSEIQSSKKFLALGLQTAAGVPLQCDEPADFMTFRIGLFGLEKLHNVARSVDHLAGALDALGIHEPKVLEAQPA